jgi:hypothetical protein
MLFRRLLQFHYPAVALHTAALISVWIYLKHLNTLYEPSVYFIFLFFMWMLQLYCTQYVFLFLLYSTSCGHVWLALNLWNIREWFRINLDFIFSWIMGTRKIKLIYGQLVATLNSLPGRCPCAPLLHIRFSRLWWQILSLLV